MAKAEDLQKEQAAAAPGNCTGVLVQLPATAGVTYNSYQCQTCHQILHVGHEDLELNGLPTEHSPVLA